MVTATVTMYAVLPRIWFLIRFNTTYEVWYLNPQIWKLEEWALGTTHNSRVGNTPTLRPIHHTQCFDTNEIPVSQTLMSVNSLFPLLRLNYVKLQFHRMVRDYMYIELSIDWVGSATCDVTFASGRQRWWGVRMSLDNVSWGRIQLSNTCSFSTGIRWQYLHNIELQWRHITSISFQERMTGKSSNLLTSIFNSIE